MRKHKEPDLMCPSCGAELPRGAYLYFWKGQWVCEDEIREVIGLRDTPPFGEISLSEICGSLHIDRRLAEFVIDECAHQFWAEEV